MDSTSYYVFQVPQTKIYYILHAKVMQWPHAVKSPLAFQHTVITQSIPMTSLNSTSHKLKFPYNFNVTGLKFYHGHGL